MADENARDAQAAPNAPAAKSSGLLQQAATLLQSPHHAMRALAAGIDKIDRVMGSTLNFDDDSLTKVHFRVNHPPSRPKADDVEVKMHLLGSLKQLGAWEEPRAKTMRRSRDGGWEVVCYLRTGEVFEYQYLLKDFDGKSVWRSSAERQQSVDDIGPANTLEIVDFITKGEEETGSLYNAAVSGSGSKFRALPPPPCEMSGDHPAVSLPECPDAGRDSECALPRDSFLPPPPKTLAPNARGSISGFQDCRRVSVVPSRDCDFDDCSEEGDLLLNLPCAKHRDSQVESEGVQRDSVLSVASSESTCSSDAAAKASSRVSSATTLEWAAEQISSLAGKVQEPAADFAGLASALEESPVTEEGLQEGNLVKALITLVAALDRRQEAQAAAMEQQKMEQEVATRHQQQQQQQVMDSFHVVEQQCDALQAQLDEKDIMYSTMQKGYQEQIVDKDEALAAAREEITALQANIEEEKQLVKMNARRLRGGIRKVQGQLEGVRGGFDDLRSEVVTMTSDILPELKGMAGKLEASILRVAQGVQAELDDTMGKFQGEVKERKRLHNLVQELKGNIRVFARVRPISGREKESGRKSVVLCPSETEMSLCAGGKLSTFNFDRVFGQESTQEEVFAETEPLVVSVLDGYNVCIFAYGQTGSGKTHTMQGSEAMRGVNFRSLEMLFQMAHDRRMVATYEFKVSLLEIYNEQIKDLIETTDSKGSLKKLDVKNDPNGGTYVAAVGGDAEAGLKTVQVNNIEDILEVFELGMRNRATSSTQMNSTSSRSHCVFSVHTTCTDLLKGGTSFGKMHLVDLAGSERLSRTGAEGERLTEAKNINKSLSALGNCISSLVSKAKFTPYRDSKLTHFLQDSLGGDAKMLMFVCASPCDTDSQESKCSLEFATRVGTVELGAARRKGDGGAGAALNEMQKMLKSTQEEASKAGGAKEKLQEELAGLKEEIKAKTHESDCLLQSLRSKEREMTDKEKAAADKLAAHEKKHAELLQEIQLLKTQRPATVIKEVVREVAAAAASTAPDHTGQPATKQALMSTPATLSQSVSQSCSLADDVMSASVCNKIALEAAAVVAAAVSESAQEPEANAQQPDAAEISFSEVEEKENADGNNCTTTECCSVLATAEEPTEEHNAKTESGGQQTEADGRTETLEERLERFRQKKEEIKRKNALLTPGLSATPKREIIVKKATDAGNSPASVSAAPRVLARPQTALSRPATAMHKTGAALGGGALRPRSAISKSAIPSVHDKSEKSGGRVRHERERPWRSGARGL